MKLSIWVTVALVTGFLFGLLLHNYASSSALLAFVGVFSVGGSLFLSALQFLVVPVVLFSLLGGVLALGDLSRLGSIGLQTLALFVGTTFVALGLAIGIALIVDPAGSFSLATTLNYSPPQPPSLTQILGGLVPKNPIQALVEANMLQIIIMTILIGAAILRVKPLIGPISQGLDKIGQVMIQLVNLIMLYAPIGVFCLLAKVTAEHGVGAIQSQLKYFFCVLGVLFVQLFMTYGLMVKVLAKRRIFKFFHQAREVILVAFSTSSSNATLPITLSVAKDELKLDPKISSFVIPLGATINMNGTAIMQGVAVVFVAGVYGVDLSVLDYLLVVGMATLAAIGTAGVPSVGLITLAMVFEQVQIPVEGIALILAVDRLLDMVRTVVNVLGDLTVSTVIDKWSGTRPGDPV